MTRLSPRMRRWCVGIAAAIGMAVTGSLGVWQMGRAELKQQLQSQRESRQSLQALSSSELVRQVQQDRWNDLFDRSVHLEGEWVAEATVFLDNRPMAGRTGFVVLTPLKLKDADLAVVVQRGWVPRRIDDRTAVPDVPTPEGTVVVSGRLAPAPSKLYEFDPQTSGRIRQNIDIPAYGTEWSLTLPPASVQEADSGQASDGLARQWPLVGADVHKHYGYAFQWFGLCALIMVLYVWFQIIAPRRRSD